jgi:hypothetical protein
MDGFELPVTRYALSGDVSIAYQVMGDGRSISFWYRVSCPAEWRYTRRHASWRSLSPTKFSFPELSRTS